MEHKDYFQVAGEVAEIRAALMEAVESGALTLEQVEERIDVYKKIRLGRITMEEAAGPSDDG